MAQKTTDIAKKLLGENEPSYIWGNMGFRDGEYDGITTERMFEFLKAYPIYGIAVSSNSYGKFQFITVKTITYANDGTPMETGITFWGNGYHEYRDQYVKLWQMNVQSFLHDGSEITDKESVMAQILSRAESLPVREESNGNSYSELANFTDDDFAMANIEGWEG